MVVDGVLMVFIVIFLIFGSIVIFGIILILLRVCIFYGGIYKYFGGFGNIDIVNRRLYDLEVVIVIVIGIFVIWGGGCDIGGVIVFFLGWGGGCDVWGVVGLFIILGFGGGGGSGMGGC